MGRLGARVRQFETSAAKLTKDLYKTRQLIDRSASVALTYNEKMKRVEDQMRTLNPGGSSPPAEFLWLLVSWFISGIAVVAWCITSVYNVLTFWRRDGNADGEVEASDGDRSAASDETGGSEARGEHARPRQRRPAAAAAATTASNELSQKIDHVTAVVFDDDEDDELNDFLEQCLW